MNAELKQQVRVAAYDANDVPAISPDERIRVYTSKEHVCHCIPITNRSLGLTVPIFENGKTVEYWFEKGIRDVDLVLKHNSSIGDEYIFDGKIFEVASPDQVKHIVHLNNPNIELTKDSFIYGIYDEQTDKKDTFKIGDINGSIYLDAIYTDGDEKNYFHFDKNEFKVDIDGKITLKYSDGIQNGIVSKIGIADDITLSHSNGNDLSELVITEDVNINSTNEVNVISKDINIRGSDIINIVSGKVDSTATINIENKGTGHINLILNNANSNNDILIKNTGHGDINIDSQYAIHVQGANNVTIHGTELLELNSTEEIDIKSGNEITVQASVILMKPTTRFTVDGSSSFNYLIDYQTSAVSITNSSGGKKISLNSTNGVELCNNSGTNYFRLYDALADNTAHIEIATGSSSLAGNIYIKNNGSGQIILSKNIYTNEKSQISIGSSPEGLINLTRGSSDRGLDVIQLNNAGIRLATGFNTGVLKDIQLITNNHNFVIEQTSFKIGKLVGTEHPYETIPECIFPLLHDLNYSNNISVQDGGYWSGNAGSTDSRNIQRFTSIFGNDNKDYFEIKNNANERTFTFSETYSFGGNSYRQNLFTLSPDGLVIEIFKANGDSADIQAGIKLGGGNIPVLYSRTEYKGIIAGAGQIRGYDDNAQGSPTFEITPAKMFLHNSNNEEILIDSTGISFTDHNGNTISKTWQQLLS